MDQYVELELVGVEAGSAMPGLRTHLEGCSACNEDLRGAAPLRGARVPPSDPWVYSGEVRIALDWRSHEMTPTIPQAAASIDIRLKRAYEPAASADGYRVLIDRLWPRGVSRQKARLDAWERELSPSTELRQVVWSPAEPLRGVPPALHRGTSRAAPATHRATSSGTRRHADPRLCRARQRAQRRRRSRDRPATRTASA